MRGRRRTGVVRPASGARRDPFVGVRRRSLSPREPQATRGADPATRIGPRPIPSAAFAAPENGLYLGIGRGGWAWAGAERSALVLGPSRAGKTTSIVVPNVLAAPGAVVNTSTKPDVMGQTAAARRDVGWTMVFDPSGSTEALGGVVRVGWSPLNAARNWDGALSMADAMVNSRVRGNRGARASNDDHWSERAASLLAPMLHAAAIDGLGMREVLSWVDRHDGAPALRVLTQHTDDALATDVLSGILATDEREQSGIWSTASGVLAAYRSRSALASTEPPYLDPAAFCEGANTLFVCSAGTQQQLMAPLVVGLLAELRDAAYERARRGTSVPPVLFALDEVANIAPLPDLPSIVSEGAGQGLLTLACLQDLSQARGRWGSQAEGFISLFGTTVVLPGIADIATLSALSTLSGDEEVVNRTLGRSQGADGRLRGSVSLSTTRQRRLPPDVIARGVPGGALAIDARRRMGWVRLTPAHRDSPWRELTGRSRAADLFGRG
ncbi:MAG: type IV secretory system conjugative DNA transfer family protein [Acidimicrobiales bacterium]